MFTGIVQTLARVHAIEDHGDFRRHILDMDPIFCKNLQLGASIAHNGCCLTVVAIHHQLIAFDLIQSTLAITNLGQLKVNDLINIERAAVLGDEIGGHLMSGHIMAQATIIEQIDTPNNRTLWLSVPEHCAPYLFDKGYVGLDGVSLTIGSVRQASFCVHLIPETLKRTNFAWKTVGDTLNLEIDPQTQTIVDTVRRELQKHQNLSNRTNSD